MPRLAAVHTSKNSSSVPMPPGSTRNASARRSISALRSRMVSTRTSSSESWSATSIATRWRGITPIVWPPAALAAAPTAPIIATEPPPVTSVWPRPPMAAPTAAASSRWAGSILVMDAQ